MRRDPAWEGSIMIMRQLLQRADAQGHLAVEMGREGEVEGGVCGEGVPLHKFIKSYFLYWF